MESSRFGLGLKYPVSNCAHIVGGSSKNVPQLVYDFMEPKPFVMINSVYNLPSVPSYSSILMFNT